MDGYLDELVFPTNVGREGLLTSAYQAFRRLSHECGEGGSLALRLRRQLLQSFPQMWGWRDDTVPQRRR